MNWPVIIPAVATVVISTIAGYYGWKTSTYAEAARHERARARRAADRIEAILRALEETGDG